MPLRVQRIRELPSQHWRAALPSSAVRVREARPTGGVPASAGYQKKFSGIREMVAAISSGSI